MATTTLLEIAPQAIDQPTNMMLSTARSRAVWQLSRRAAVAARRTYAFSANDNKEINVEGQSKEVPNVSKTNELPIESHHKDEAMQESVEEGEKLRVAQAPNRQNVWSRSQNPRAKAMSGPRFEQTIMEYQVCGNIYETKSSTNQAFLVYLCPDLLISYSLPLKLPST